jgi:hypothetical protein
VGDHRLFDPLRRRPSARRPARRPPRPPAPVHRRGAAVHGQLTARRPRLVRGIADRLSVVAGPRRGAALAGGALDPDHNLPRGTRAKSRARNLGRRLGKRRCRRRAARRGAHERVQLVVDLLHQRSGGHRSARSHAVPAAREQSRPRPPAIRHRRRCLDHRRPDAAGLRVDARDAARLGDALDGWAAGRIGCARRRVRRDRTTLEGASTAARNLPPADADGRRT